MENSQVGTYSAVAIFIIGAAAGGIGVGLRWVNSMNHKVSNLEESRTALDKKIDINAEDSKNEFVHVRGEMRRRFSEVADKLDRTHDLSVTANSKLDMLLLRKD